MMALIAQDNLERYYAIAAMGQLIIIGPEPGETGDAAFISSDILNVLLDAWPVSLTGAEKDSGYEISIDGLPIHGYGKTVGEAIDALAEMAIQFCVAYVGDSKKREMGFYRQATALKLLRYAGKRRVLRQMLIAALYI